MNGKMPKVMRIAQDSEIRFKVRDGRLHHEGLRIGLPNIDPEPATDLGGSIGLDKTLDLFVELPRLDPVLRKEKGPAKCHITGTIDAPKIISEDGSLVPPGQPQGTDPRRRWHSDEHAGGGHRQRPRARRGPGRGLQEAEIEPRGGARAGEDAGAGRRERAAGGRRNLPVVQQAPHPARRPPRPGGQATAGGKATLPCTRWPPK